MVRYQTKRETIRTKSQGAEEASELDLPALEQAIKSAQDHLLKLQSSQGYWVGELEADVTVSAGYIPIMYFMTGEIDPVRKQKVINFVRSKQNDDGSWSTYYDGPGDLNVTVQTYFNLKLAGVSGEEDFMQRARRFILAKGGITKTHAFTKIWLALFGQYDWKGIPSLPPEIILLPNWFYFNIYEFASWSRATIIALMVVLTKKPVCAVPEWAQVSELYSEPEGRIEYSVGKIEKLFSWKSSFLMLDKAFKAWEKLPFKPGRDLALRKVERWIVEHQEADGSWGGIMLPWLYSLFALKTLDYSLDHPVIAKGLEGLEGFIAEDDTTFRLQPATSPVWDTAWAAIALRESGLESKHPSLVAAARWLLEEKIEIGGDWQVKNPKTGPGCWAFEFDNDLYPDIDDTAVVPRALMVAKLSEGEEELKRKAVGEGLNWVLSMQSKNGGWAAFDLNNDKKFLAHIPFADFMTPYDPTSPDVTAHAIELLGATGRNHPELQKALAYVKGEQQSDGTWYGRWGVNYVYGTGLVLTSLQQAGEDMGGAYIRQAVSWLKSCQNEDGGWGETCHSYEDPASRGIGPSTASQTSWALLGLIAAAEADSPEVKRGIDCLIKTQEQDGGWQEDAYTGTGFPMAFYLRYDLYRIYFPLMVLARYRVSLGRDM
ncbi:squalene--hopene cyclase [Chloroflexota bacterium]